jgi:dihydrodipicolinate synthase/N-acetylneuraminate lyase
MTPAPLPPHQSPRPLAGVLPIVHLPFDEADRIDEAILRREIDWIFSVGADGVGTGMVSEIPRLSADERTRLAERLVEFTAGRGSVFMSVGAESGCVARAHAVAAERAGCDAVMAVPPMTTRLSADAVVDYFRGIAESVSLPLVVQDASGYVGQPIPHAACVDLLDRYGPKKVLFKPEASPLGPNLSKLRDATSGRAQIFEGSGGILLVDSYRRGIVGTMPGVDLLDGVVALWRALIAGDEESTYTISLPLSAVVALQMQAGLDGFLAIEKYLLVKRGLFRSDRRREPHGWSLDGETAREVDRLFDRLAVAISACQAVSVACGT